MALAKNNCRGQRLVSVTDWTGMGVVIYNLLCFVFYFFFVVFLRTCLFILCVISNIFL